MHDQFEIAEYLSDMIGTYGLAKSDKFEAALKATNRRVYVARSKIHWRFLKDCLENLSSKDEAITTVIESLDTVIAGKAWPEEGQAASDAVAAGTEAFRMGYLPKSACCDAAAIVARSVDRARYNTAFAAQVAHAAIFAIIKAKSMRGFAPAPNTARMNEIQRMCDAYVELVKDVPAQEAF